MGPSSLAGFCVLGVEPSLVLDKIVSYKKTLDFSSTHYHFVIGEDEIAVKSARLVALSTKQGLVVLFRAHRESSLRG
jgi:hypothetical protein